MGKKDKKDGRADKAGKPKAAKPGKEAPRKGAVRKKHAVEDAAVPPVVPGAPAEQAPSAPPVEPAAALTPAPGTFTVSVPVVALAVIDGALRVATTADDLPTAVLAAHEPLVGAAGRALAQVGLTSGGARLLPLATDTDGPGRLAASWVALARPRGGHEAAGWVEVAHAPAARAGLVRAAVDRLAALLETTTIGAALCASTFTVGELRETYAAVWGAAPDSRNFHRKVTGVADFLVETGERTSRAGGRPAMLYRAGQATQLNPALTRA